MSPKSLVLFTLVAVAQLAMATPPACLLTAVGGTVNPADIPTICKDSTMPSSISSACSGDASAAMTAFADTCKSAGVTVSDTSKASASASDSASKTGSMTVSATGSAHKTGTATAAASSGMVSATSAAGGSDGGSSGSSTGSAASSTSTPSDTSAGNPFQVGSVGAMAVAAVALVLAY
ncbi:hypothetical protein K490DRAFT_67082 [Saccharata proteae CBS 121410]|uniref:Extracellular membrane protein CFEM domain-containing protein n=1 Tax=Saccharata proteae CBS 121410 TaxID=1314787 RepID=A0A9P4LVP4_9PEZI|nr:hypothetical protein K490DRAFT_67082 [Saccharata proteae CBS 121410]